MKEGTISSDVSSILEEAQSAVMKQETQSSMIEAQSLLKEL